MLRKILKYSISCIRIIILKIKFGKRITIKFKIKNPIYIGKNCIFKIESTGKLIIDSGVYFDNYSKIEVCKEALIKIGSNVYFNNFCKIISMKKIEIGSNCMFGTNVSIYDHDHDFSNGVLNATKNYICNNIVIEDEVWCCSNVVITKGSIINKNSVIGANAVVSGNLDKNGLYVGIPVKRIKFINNKEKK